VEQKFERKKNKTKQKPNPVPVEFQAFRSGLQEGFFSHPG